jgi:methyl-accepting chemotaxis protein
VSETIGAMDRMTQQNAAMVEQTNAATKNLTSEARELALTFSGFRIAAADRSDRSGAGSAPARASRPARRPAPRPPQPAISGNLALKPAPDADTSAEDWSEF